MWRPRRSWNRPSRSTRTTARGWGERALHSRAGGAQGDRRGQRGPLGASCAGERLPDQSPLRGFARRIRAGAAAAPQLFAGAGILRRGAFLLRALGGGLSRRAACAPALTARSVRRDLLRGGRLFAIRRRKLRGGDAAFARRLAAPRRLRRRPPRADRGGRAGRPRRHRARIAGGIAARAAEHFAGMGRARNAVQAREGSGVLSGGVSKGGVGVTPVAEAADVSANRLGKAAVFVIQVLPPC